MEPIARKGQTGRIEPARSIAPESYREDLSKMIDPAHVHANVSPKRFALGRVQMRQRVLV